MSNANKPPNSEADYNFPFSYNNFNMNNYPQIIPSSYNQHNMSRIITSRGTAPPPVPRRPNDSSYSNYSGYNRLGVAGMYPNFATSMFPSTYGGYRSPFNRYGSPYYDGNFGNSIIQLAEESTRPAFQSIETIVQAASSISMMLESTYHAVHSSYSAILGVVEQFSRLKNHLAEMLSFLTFLRGLQWLCLKVLYLLGVRRKDPSTEDAWSAASAAAGSQFLNNNADPQKSAWPIFIFIGLVFGAPWLMFRLFANQATEKAADPLKWVDEKGNRFTVSALFDFVAARPQELSFQAGEKLIVAPQNLQSTAGWLLASSLDGKSVGLVPSNYLARKKSPPTPTPTTPPSSNSVVDITNEEQK